MTMPAQRFQLLQPLVARLADAHARLAERAANCPPAPRHAPS
jgi:hypothetical protein